MAELADALRSGRSESTLMWVQIPPSALDPRKFGGFFIPVFITGYNKVMPERKKRARISLPRLNLSFLQRKSSDGKPRPWVDSRLRQQVILVVVLLLLALVFASLNQRISQNIRLTTQRDQLSTEVMQLTATVQALETRKAYITSEAAVEEFARERRMIREGEVLVVPLTPPGNPTPTPPGFPTPQPTPQNWEVWWALFFGD